ncbi:MAG: adenylosuccinate lyase [Marinilabiliaceae bacterium]|nr:adenylosuccinate lyase [Marinilabiliaceae bacterium]
MSDIQHLIAISPIDGRYRHKTDLLTAYFSEYAMIRYRIMVEIEYFIALCEIPLPQLSCVEKKKYSTLRIIYKEFSVENAQRVKEIERETNHDVKAVEYYLKEQFEALGLEKVKEFIHFGLTSQDINNTSIPMALKNAFEKAYFPALNEIIFALEKVAYDWKNIAMLAKTHGQPASPTKLGKEITVFTERIKNQLKLLKRIPISGKFGGATGNFNAHYVAYPQIDWIEFGNRFLKKRFNIEREQFTTQISNYDNLAAIFDCLKRINTILLDFARDFWTYIMMNYFKQKINDNEVGSSAMPHKVNPIDFENAEGNLGIANSIFEHFSAKLPISRLQRDLSDSTVLRNIGVPFAHSLLAFNSLLNGINRLELNQEVIDKDLVNNQIVMAEAIQTILRREGYSNPYEILKKLTRTHEVIDTKIIEQFIDNLEIESAVKQELKAITPFNYTGANFDLKFKIQNLNTKLISSKNQKNKPATL